MSITNVAVQCDARHMLSPVTELSWCTGAVSRYKVDARQLLSPVTDVSTGRGGNPGLSPTPLLSRVQEPRKNRDEFINFIVRVSV